MNGRIVGRVTAYSPSSAPAPSAGFQLSLAEELQKIVVPSVAVYKDYFFDPVPCKFIAGFLEHGPDGLSAIGYGSRLMFCFKDLTEIIGRKNDRVF